MVNSNQYVVLNLQKAFLNVLVCIKTHTGGCRNHKQIHISTVPNVDSVAICLNECRMNEFCTGFSVSIKKKVCILYSGECEKDGNQNWDYYRTESCMGDLEIGNLECNFK